MHFLFSKFFIYPSGCLHKKWFCPICRSYWNYLGVCCNNFDNFGILFGGKSTLKQRCLVSICKEKIIADVMCVCRKTKLIFIRSKDVHCIPCSSKSIFLAEAANTKLSHFVLATISIQSGRGASSIWSRVWESEEDAMVIRRKAQDIIHPSFK